MPNRLLTAEEALGKPPYAYAYLHELIDMLPRCFGVGKDNVPNCNCKGIFEERLSK